VRDIASDITQIQQLLRIPLGAWLLVQNTMADNVCLIVLDIDKRLKYDKE
jgi:hypothetical protein